MKIGYEKLKKVLFNNKENFITNWYNAVLQNIPEYLKNDFKLNKNDFNKLFEIYSNETITSDDSIISKRILSIFKDKVYSKYPLSIISYINSYFMSTARKILKDIYPFNTDARMNYLESIAQNILNAEICIAQSVEDKINELKIKNREITDGLKNKNKMLVDFFDLATHEMQSPLWSILGFTTKLKKKYFSVFKEDGKHYLDRIFANVTEMHQLIEDILTILMIDHEKMMFKKIFLRDIILETEKKIKKEIDADFKLIWERSNTVIIGDPECLRLVFYQIFKNSAQYVFDNMHGKVYLKVEKTKKNSIILIDDEGIGIEKEYHELVIKPMERLKEKNVIGIGMGLAIVKRIIEVHSGSIKVEDGHYGGIRIKITFPLSSIILK